MKSNFKNTLCVKKGAAKNLKKDRNEKELKSKWVAKAGVALLLMRIKF